MLGLPEVRTAMHALREERLLLFMVSLLVLERLLTWAGVLRSSRVSQENKATPVCVPSPPLGAKRSIPGGAPLPVVRPQPEAQVRVRVRSRNGGASVARAVAPAAVAEGSTQRVGEAPVPAPASAVPPSAHTGRETATGVLEKLTMAEVARRTEAGKTYLVLRRQVYDATPFVTCHPGGEEPIRKWAGKDATKAFMEVPSHKSHQDDVEKAMKMMHIGYIAP